MGGLYAHTESNVARTFSSPGPALLRLCHQQGLGGSQPAHCRPGRWCGHSPLRPQGRVGGLGTASPPAASSPPSSSLFRSLGGSARGRQEWPHQQTGCLSQGGSAGQQRGYQPLPPCPAICPAPPSGQGEASALCWSCPGEAAGIRPPPRHLESTPAPHPQMPPPETHRAGVKGRGGGLRERTQRGVHQGTSA